jgi:hypothetical protein
VFFEDAKVERKTILASRCIQNCGYIMFKAFINSQFEKHISNSPTNILVALKH